MNHAKRAVIYDRASTHKQEGNWSREDAERIGKQLARQHVPGYPVELRQEIKSGESLLNRPVMLSTLDDIEAGKVKALIVQNFSRLSRDEDGIDGLTIKRLCKLNNVLVITPGKVYDFLTSEDDKLSDIELMVARWYKAELIKYTMQGMTAKALAGGFLGGVPPYGYKLVYTQANETDKPIADLAISKRELPIIEELFNVYCDGTGANGTARHLTQRGYRIKTRRKKQTKDNVSEREFQRYDVLRIVKRPLYIGFIEWGKNKQSRHLDAFEPEMVHRPELQMIPIKTWELANTIRGKRATSTPGAGKWASYALTGTLGCAQCNGSVSGWSGDGYTSYRCNAHHKRWDQTECAGYTVREHLAAGAILPMLADVINNQVGLNSALSQAADEYGRTPIELSIVNKLEAELHVTTEAKQRVMDFIADGVMNKTEAKQKLNELRTKQERLQRKLVESRQKDIIRKEYLEAVRDLQSVDLEKELFTMLEHKPKILKRVLQMVFEQNSVIIETQRKGNSWWGELISYEFTENFKSVLSSNHVADGYWIQWALDLSELMTS